MTTYFVSRHTGAEQWISQQGIEIDEKIDHIDPAIVKCGDTVIGSLPVNLVAEVYKRGGRYFHLTLDMPREIRGKELTVDDMAHCNARLEEFIVLLKD